MTARKIHRRPDADPRNGVEKYGKATFADPVNTKYPIDRPGRIKATWAYIHQPLNAGKYTDEEVRTIKIRIRRAAKARKMALPDPDAFVELMARVRKRKNEEEEGVDHALAAFGPVVVHAGAGGDSGVVDVAAEEGPAP